MSYYVIPLLLALFGYMIRSLTLSGALATACVGAGVVYGLGLPGLFVLILFFGSSSLLSRFGKVKKRGVDEIIEKEGARDAMQVIANGGSAFAGAVLCEVTGDTDWLLLFLGAIAGSNADTWASEIGPLSKKDPVLIGEWRRVPAGTSGAVSLLGTTATVAGAAFIALAGALLFDEWRLFLLITAVGTLGSLLDTWFGKRFQRRYRCVVCGRGTEKKAHHGVPTELIEGKRLIGNDAVNFTSSTIAALIGFAMQKLW